MDELEFKLFPIAIIQDRYGGCYSKGKWVAISNYGDEDSEFDEYEMKLEYLLDSGMGDDVESRKFWDTYRDAKYLAVGSSPHEAMENLRKKNIDHIHSQKETN